MAFLLHRMAMITFAADVNVDFDLDSNSDRDDVIDSIMSVNRHLSKLLVYYQLYLVFLLIV